MPVGQTKNNQQLTTASTFHYVGAVALYIYPPDLSGGIFNIIANKCKLTPLFDTSSTHRIVYRLYSGRDSYIANGGKLGRKKGCIKTAEQKKEEYKEVISFLKRGYSVRNTAKLCFTNPLPLGKVKTFPLHSLNRGFQALALAQCKE